MSNTGRGVVKAPVELHSLAYHADDWSDAFDERLLWSSAELVPGATLFITSRAVRDLAPSSESRVETHSHPAPQTYLVIGSPSLSVVAEIAGERSEVDSPATVHVPANVQHTFHFASGSGTVISILQASTYE